MYDIGFVLLVILLANVGPIEVKKLLNAFAMSCLSDMTESLTINYLNFLYKLFPKLFSLRD